jgi:putative membrane protein
MTRWLAPGLALIVALEHVYILVLEMFFWNKPAGLQAFNLTQEFADATTALAANQGLYNGFLAAGLFWGVFTRQRPVTVFFLLCVVVAGVFGAVTAAPKIFFVQALPALIALAATGLERRRVAR